MHPRLHRCPSHNNNVTKYLSHTFPYYMMKPPINTPTQDPFKINNKMLYVSILFNLTSISIRSMPQGIVYRKYYVTI